MPVILPEGLPAVAALRSEGIEVLTRQNPPSGAVGTLRIALMNLMPDKITTEAQIARLLGATPFHIHLTLAIPDGCSPKTTAGQHISDFYARWSQVRARRFDGLIVTGAPVEHLAFEQVTYWREMKEILDWSRTHVGRSLFICWAAQAALFHFYRVPKRELAEKAFGVFPQWVTERDAPLLRGFGGDFPVPVSRHTEVSANDLPADAGLRILARSCQSGLCLLEDPAREACYMFNHFEYDSGTLNREYARDLRLGEKISRPAGLSPQEGQGRTAVDCWRFHAQLFFQNWANEIALAIPAHARAVLAPDGSSVTRSWAGRARRLILGSLSPRSRGAATEWQPGGPESYWCRDAPVVLSSSGPRRSAGKRGARGGTQTKPVASRGDRGKP